MNDRNGNPTNVEHTYKLRSNSISTLSVTNPTASFSGKANITEIVNGVEQSIEGNCIMQLTVFDGGPKGGGNTTTINGVSAQRFDSLGIVIFRNKGGVWYSNNWNGTKTVNARICYGDVSTSGTSGTTSTQTASTQQAVTMNTVMEETDTRFGLTAFPNPTQNQFKVHVESSNRNDKIMLRVYDAYGRTVRLIRDAMAGQTITLGNEYRPGIYYIEMIQGKNRQQVKLLKVVY
jgi:hypothetical protein